MNSNKIRSSSFLYRVTVLLLVVAAATPCISQPSPQAHPLPQAIIGKLKIQVPDVRGHSEEDARVTLRKAGLTPGKVSTTAGPGIVGTVFQQDPLQNSMATHGATFNLVLVGPPTGNAANDGDQEFRTQVPDLAGLTPNQARTRLDPKRLVLGSVMPGNGQGTEGTVYSQNPKPRSWAKIGSPINVSIVQSKGPSGSEDILWAFVPDLTGQTQKAAEETLHKQNLTVGGISSGVASVQAGTVFGQRPLPNTRIIQGSSVDLRIAQVPPPQSILVAVPSLLSQDLDGARTLLGKKKLQLGRVASEESVGPVNSILSQSPMAATLVERGSAVDVKIAQPIPPVSVPNIVQREETDAIHILQSAGLQLGSMDEKESDAPTGTIIIQRPDAGAQVPKGSAVNVILSRQHLAQLTVLMDQANPTKGQPVVFHAHLEPPEKAVQYRFVFGDGKDSGLLTSSKTTHIYQHGGNFEVQAFATLGATSFKSEQVTVTIPPFPWGLIVAATGLLALGYLGSIHLRRMRFHRLIRVAPKADAGTQSVSVQRHEDWNLCARFRLVHDPGNSTILLEERKHEGISL
jgi:beta-lactam-binding protein with PASTA domain